MPKIKDMLVGKMSKLVERVSVDGTDQWSGAKRENMKWGTYVDGKFKKELQSLRALMALPEPEAGYVPRNVEELNLYEAEGGFKLAYEETMERLLKYAFDQSLWEEDAKELIIKDLITNGYASVVDYYDKYEGQVKCKYVDAEYAGVQYTKQDANYNPDYGFYVDMVKMSDLRMRGFGVDQLENVAETFSSHFGNPSFEDYNKSNKVAGSSNISDLDDYVIPVFVVYWKDVEFKNEKQYKNRQGKVRTKPVDAKYKYKNGEKELTTRIKINREVHWVVSTELVYDYGKCEFQARDGKKEPVLPIHMVQVNNRPIVPRLIPSLDQYMNGWMKLQQGLSMAAMNGYAINMDAVSNLKMGDEKLHPKEVLRLWRQTGNLFFKPTDVMGRPNTGQFRPIEQLPGGAGAVINEAMQVMNVAVSQIEQLTGINPISLGEQPNPETGKAVTEYSMMGTNDILSIPLRRVNILKSNVARAMCLRLSHVISADKTAYNTYKDVVGETSLEAVKMAEGHDVKYGIRTHARQTDSEVQAIREMLAMALKNGRDGKARITEADYIRFESMLAAGESLKRIALLLDFALDKAVAAEEARASKLQKENIQGTQMLEQQKAQQDAQKLSMETQADIAKDSSKNIGLILQKAVEKGEISALQAISMLGGVQPPQQQQQPVPTQEPQAREERVLPTGEQGV